ncbi:hypothetical protein HID58_055786, partial [Brassica napus]
RLPSVTIKQSAEPAETVASVLAGHQAGSGRSSHRSPVPSLDILVAIHSCRNQNQSHQNKKDSTDAFHQKPSSSPQNPPKQSRQYSLAIRQDLTIKPSLSGTISRYPSRDPF